MPNKQLQIKWVHITYTVLQYKCSMCYMNWEVLLAMCIWDFTCVVNCSECVSCQTLKSFQLKIERPEMVTTSGISKMRNIHIQSVIHTPNP